MSKTEAERAKKKRWQKKIFTNPIKRVRTVETMDLSERKRLDNVLINTEIPLVDLRKRFNLKIDQLRNRLRELGLRAGIVQKVSHTQERIPLEPRKTDLEYESFYNEGKEDHGWG